MLVRHRLQMAHFHFLKHPRLEEIFLQYRQRVGRLLLESVKAEPQEFVALFRSFVIFAWQK